MGKNWRKLSARFCDELDRWRGGVGGGFGIGMEIAVPGFFSINNKWVCMRARTRRGRMVFRSDD